MWSVYRAGVFTYFFFFFFSLKNLKTDKTKRRVRKTKEETFQKIKDLLMMEETVNKDFEKASKEYKKPR